MNLSGVYYFNKNQELTRVLCRSVTVDLALYVRMLRFFLSGRVFI